MSILEMTSVAMVFVEIAKVVIQSRKGSPVEPHGPHKTQPSKNPPRTSSRATNVRQVRSAASWRFIRNNPVSIVESFIQTSYLVWVATRPAPLSGLVMVVVALVAADLHATIILWMLGGTDRTIARIAGGKPPLDIAPRDDEPN